MAVDQRNRDLVMVEVPQNVLDELRMEPAARRSEARQAAALAPIARYVHRRVAIDCDPQTEQMQGAVVRYLERLSRRGE